MTRTIAFQGAPGAYSHMACKTMYPALEALPCTSFEDVFAAVNGGAADLAMIPIENSHAGRVADIHHLLPHSGLTIIAETFQRIRHQLLGVRGARLETVTTVHSHVQALSQCRKTLRDLRLQPLIAADTAGAARDIAGRNDPAHAAIASKLAAEIYDLEILKADIEDTGNNTTRFLVMTREAPLPPPTDTAHGSSDMVTSFVFRVRSVPAALYKALGGFATNGVNMTKLESYLVDGHFVAAQFYAEVEGHPADVPLGRALEELGFFAHEVNLLGTYPAHPQRFEGR